MSGRAWGSGGRGAARGDGGRGPGRGDGGRGAARGDGGRGPGRGDGGRGPGRGDGGRGSGRGDGGRGGYSGPSPGGGRGGAVAGGGRGGYRDQPAPSPAYGRGGNVSVPVVPVSQSVVPVSQPVVPVSQTVAPAPYAEASSSSAVSLSRDVEKMTLGSSAGPSVQQPESVAPVVQLPSSSKTYRVPVRPGFGREGRKCMVRANHFLVKVKDNDLHHYDVTIKPEVLNKKVCRDIMMSLDASFRLSHLGNKQLAYDGRKSVYTAGPLPFISKEFVVKLEEKDRVARKEREFKVSIKFASRPDLHHLRQFLASRQLDIPHETIQLFDVVLRQTPSKDNTVVGRSFFNSMFGAGDLGDGLEFWKGFYQSLRPTQMGLSINIDMSARAFYEPVMVSEFVAKFCRKDLNRALSDIDRLKVKKALRGIRVEFRNRDYMRRYKVLSLSTQPLSQLTFTDETGGRISVAQYFLKKYNIKLTYTSLPALNAGTDAEPKYLPMEVCMIVEGQRCAKKLNERQVSSLLKATCQRPVDRETTIKRMVTHNDYNGDKLCQEFGIQVGTDMTSIEARVLNPPKLKYHATSRESVIEPRVGQWNMIDKKMINGGIVEHWACVNLSRLNPGVVQNFCENLVKMCRSRGMDFNPQPLLPIQAANPNVIERTLCDIYNQCDAKLQKTGKYLQMLIIILPDASGSYGAIKRICETKLGIVSQCCQPKNVYKGSMQYLENLSLKINVKVGGRNTVLVSAPPVVRDCPTIIFGADVTHPQPGEDSSPSIAAVVASMDWPEVTKYRGLYSAQGHRDEIIKDLYSTHVDPQKGVIHSGMIRDHLRAFYRATNLQPRRIIFYRDGVSEGQFNQVLLEEMDAIRKACQSLQADYLPPVTFVVVQKRHHTRLFPAVHNDRQSTDKSGNILPGTVVDTSICHPTEFDFYLCSHAGIQGTSRPTHYHVLYDENKFSADALQALTNNLTYTYARCTRSVSIVPPAYYAHLTAFRARYYMEGDTSDGDSSSGGRATREGNAAVRQLPATKENVKNVMFYC